MDQHNSESSTQPVWRGPRGYSSSSSSRSYIKDDTLDSGSSAQSVLGAADTGTAFTYHPPVMNRRNHGLPEQSVLRYPRAFYSSSTSYTVTTDSFVRSNGSGQSLCKRNKTVLLNGS